MKKYLTLFAQYALLIVPATGIVVFTVSGGFFTSVYNETARIQAQNGEVFDELQELDNTVRIEEGNQQIYLDTTNLEEINATLLSLEIPEGQYELYIQAALNPWDDVVTIVLSTAVLLTTLIAAVWYMHIRIEGSALRDFLWDGLSIFAAVFTTIASYLVLLYGLSISYLVKQQDVYFVMIAVILLLGTTAFSLLTTGTTSLKEQLQKQRMVIVGGVPVIMLSLIIGYGTSSVIPLVLVTIAYILGITSLHLFPRVEGISKYVRSRSRAKVPSPKQNSQKIHKKKSRKRKTKNRKRE